MAPTVLVGAIFCVSRWDGSCAPLRKLAAKIHRDRPEPGQIHHDFVACAKPQRLYEASGQNGLARAQAFAASGEMIGEPRQRMVGMAEHIGAGAPPCLIAIDERTAGHVEEIGRGPSRDGFAEHATGGEDSSATKVGAPSVCQST